jgi:peptidoglycan/xylan/chitin deacetylase (PgdA/CDA1 family)
MISIVKKIGFSIFNEIGVTRAYRAQKKNKITILNLHRISPERDFFFNPITPGHFELLLKYVSKHYSVVTVADINNLPVSQQESGKPYLVLSFDDGYYDFIEYALPLLIKYNLPSNHNIVNSCANNNEIIWTHRLNNIFNHCREKGINLQWNFEDGMPLSVSGKTKNLVQLYSQVFKILLNTPYQKRIQWISEKENELSVSASCAMMNWNQVTECTKYRVEIGSHTLNHDALATITDPGCLQNEIQQSKIEIEKKIQKPVDILALPNGQTNKDIVAACTNAGIMNILFVDDKVNSWSNFGVNKVNLISRINISDEAPGEMFLRTELFHSRIRNYVRF